LSPTTLRQNTCADGVASSADVICTASHACASGACVAKAPSQLQKIQVFDIDQNDFCIVGNACTGTSCCTVGGISFANDDNLIGIKQRDRYIYENQGMQEVCGRESLSTLDQNQIAQGVNDMINRVSSATGNAVNLSTNITHLSGQFTVSRQPGTCNWWYAPKDLKDFIATAGASESDGVLVVAKSDTGLGTLPVGSTSITVDQSQGVAGAAYSFVDIGYGYNEPLGEIGDRLLSAWGNQLASSLKLGVTDPRGTTIYSGVDTYPACLASTTAYFPTLDACTVDPASTSCGLGSCADVSAYHTKVLQTDYNPAWTLVGNHCRDLKKDVDEIGVDCGGATCQTCP
jgi:hypothetical protein